MSLLHDRSRLLLLGLYRSTKTHNLPKYIYYYNKTSYKVENLTSKTEYFKTLDEAVMFRNNIILEDVIKCHGNDSHLYTYIKSLL